MRSVYPCTTHIAAKNMKHALLFTWTAGVFGPILTTFSVWHVFIKVLNIKSDGNPSGGNRVDTCGRTDIMELRGALFFVNMRTRVKIHYHQPSTSSSLMAGCMPSIRTTSPQILLPLIGKGDSGMGHWKNTINPAVCLILNAIRFWLCI